jgi:hypothetical protein
VAKSKYKYSKPVTKPSPRLDFKSLVCDKKLCFEIGQWFDFESASVSSFEDLVVLLNKCCQDFIPVKVKTKRHKDWFDKSSEHLLKIVELKRVAKQQNDLIAFRKLRGDLQRECRKAESNFWKDISLNMQNLYNKNQSQLFFQNLKSIYGNKRSDINEGFLLNLDGSISKTKTEIQARWNEHFLNLLNQSGSAIFDKVVELLPLQLEVDDGLANDFTIVEVCLAIDQMKHDKAVGKDKIPIEFFKYVESIKLVKVLVLLFNKSLRSGVVENIIKDVIIAVLFKKGSALDCNNYRGLSLISHLGKVLERLIQNRLICYVEDVIRFLPESQNGFRSGRSTVDSIFCSRLISSYCRDKHLVCIKCFVDLTKAYDKVDRQVLWLILKRLGIPEKLIELIKNIHVGSTGTVRTDGEFGEAFLLSVGLKQGSIFAPLLFNIYNTCMILAIEKKLEGCGIKLRFRLGSDIFNLDELKALSKVKKCNLLHLLYADDCVIVASSLSEMQLIVDVFDEVSKIFGQLISIKKTEILSVARDLSEVPDTDIKIDGISLKRVANFKYVGSTENSTGTMVDEIKIRIQRMAMSFNKLSRRLFFNKNISLKVKLLMFEVFVLSAGLYGCATWNTSAEDIRNLEVWQQRSIRKMLNIKWFQHISFLDIVNLAAQYDYKILPIECRIRQSRLKYFGHVSRMDDSRLPKILLHAECDLGQRLVGQPETNYRNCIKQDLKLFGIKEWRVSVLDRIAWRVSIFHGKEFFLKKWWTDWVRKYSVRHEISKSIGKGSAGVTDKERKLDAILSHEKIVSGKVEKLIPVSCDASIVRRILVVDGCIKDILSEVEQRCQLDLLEDGMWTGSRNISTEDSLMKRSRNRNKNRKD